MMIEDSNMVINEQIVEDGLAICDVVLPELIKTLWAIFIGLRRMEKLFPNMKNFEKL